MSDKEENDSKEIKDITQKHKEIFVRELTKFLDAYNHVARTSFILDLRGEYDKFIRILGNYIFCEYSNTKQWDSTKIVFTDDVCIDFSLFKGTRYYNSVESFLISLKKSFYQSIDDDVYNYLHHTKDFTEDEKIICGQFYDRISDLNNAMKKATFSTKDKDIVSQDSISSYSKELKEFNQFSNYISSNKQLFGIISRFDRQIREIAKNKKSDEILFNV